MLLTLLDLIIEIYCTIIFEGLLFLCCQLLWEALHIGHHHAITQYLSGSLQPQLWGVLAIVSDVLCTQSQTLLHTEYSNHNTYWNTLM